MVAVAPLFLHGAVRAIFTVGTDRQARWTPADREVFLAVVHSLDGALARAEQLRAQERRAALDAFVSLTEAIGTETDQRRLAERACQLILAFLPGWTAGYAALEGGRWKGVVVDVPDPALRERLRAGVPLETPGYRAAVASRGPVFIDRWNAQEQGVEGTETYGLAGFYPIFEHGEPVGMFVVGTMHADAWCQADRSVFAVVGRSLGLALDWAGQARTMSRQNGMLENERAGLHAFAAYSEAVGSETDVLAMARLAIETIRMTAPAVSVSYFEPEDGRWKARLLSEDIGPEIAEQLRSGVPMDAPDFAGALRSGVPQFVTTWDVEANHLERNHDHAYDSVAFLPIIVRGEGVAFVTAGIADARPWSEREQAVIRGVVRGLAVTLERSVYTRDLARQHEALDARTAALSAANRELEAFTYSASHDLRTPVRHIAGFADLAVKALGAGQTERVAQHLGVVRRGAERMTELIDGMLALSRAGRDDLQPGPVPLGHLLLQARRDAELEFPERPVEWHLPAEGQVWGDRRLLQQVMTNLVSNAVKFSSTRDTSDITVRVEETPDGWTVAVQDNGVGFDTAYAGKLFGVFQRLHTQHTFQGTGVGLATVQRIVHRHGGQVFADSGPGGATFGFTLPRPAEPGRSVT